MQIGPSGISYLVTPFTLLQIHSIHRISHALHIVEVNVNSNTSKAATTLTINHMIFHIQDGILRFPHFAMGGNSVHHSYWFLYLVLLIWGCFRCYI